MQIFLVKNVIFLCINGYIFENQRISQKEKNNI